ncbi:MAG TPA: NAD(P)-dependent oxidoreductase [Acidimicrobiales bacterium]|nr:NAD(P)-dependent oxidoreductase [Acidimicrobiales bacterium]
MKLDCTFRVRSQHRVGEFAKLAATIAEGGGLIGDMETVRLGPDTSIRDITIEVDDMAQAEHIADLLARRDTVQVLWFRDRALLRHEGGKLTIQPVHPVETVQEMRDYYTPGVARVCTAIAESPDLASRYTMIGRTVAICTNGTRVLGLGNLGPVAAMPVMEGKAMFYQQFAGISAMPVLIAASSPQQFVETVIRIAPTFGGIHLEDISTPECFEIERQLIDALDKPVMHDDVHGTAVVVLAAVITACRQVGVELKAATVGQIGLGAAGFGIAALAADSGIHRVLATDPSPLACEHAATHPRIEIVDLDTVLRDADVVIATTGKAGLIQPAMVRPGQVILALSNPSPEIAPEIAIAAGAAFAADGRSVNNVLAYPGIFRGAFLAGAETINLEMKLAASRAIADLSDASTLIPDVLDRSVHDHVARAVRDAAELSGVAHPERAAVGLE